MTEPAAPIASSRDFASEMQSFIKNNEPSGDVVLATFAIHLVEKLEREDPELLHGWLMVQAPTLLHGWIADQWRVKRRQETGKRRAFDVGLRAGDVSGVFSHRFVIADDNTRRRLGDMTGSDHRYVANSYERDSKTAAMHAALHRAVARTVGKKRTEEVLTAEEWEALCDKYL